MSGVKWDWSHSSQSSDYFAKVNNKFVDKCLDHKSNWRRLTGLPVIIGFTSLDVIQRIALIFEQLIKGVVNIVGAVIPGSRFSAKKGGKQLLLVPLNVIRLASTAAFFPLNLVVAPLSAAIAPDWTKKVHTKPTRAQVKLARAQI